jgi:hypothetical protein
VRRWARRPEGPQPPVGRDPCDPADTRRDRGEIRRLADPLREGAQQDGCQPHLHGPGHSRRESDPDAREADRPGPCLVVLGLPGKRFGDAATHGRARALAAPSGHGDRAECRRRCLLCFDLSGWWILTRLLRSLSVQVAGIGAVVARFPGPESEPERPDWRSCNPQRSRPWPGIASRAEAEDVVKCSMAGVGWVTTASPVCGFTP